MGTALTCVPARKHALQHGEEDINFDGKPDVISFVANVQSDAPIHGVKALLQFHYSFDVRRLSLYACADDLLHACEGDVPCAGGTSLQWVQTSTVCVGLGHVTVRREKLSHACAALGARTSRRLCVGTGAYIGCAQKHAVVHGGGCI